MRRFGQVIKLKPEKYEYYKELHANPWPEVLAKIKECNLQNYNIFHKDGYLFAYFEYTGDDFEADMAKMMDDPKTQEWWRETDPCQTPIDENVTSHYEGEWWANMEELFFVE